MNNPFKVNEKVLRLSEQAQDMTMKIFTEIDKLAEINSQRVLGAFINHRIGEAQLQSTTGYGYGDTGRDTLDKVWAEIFGAPSALVRHSFISGTHALTVALFGVLRPGDTLLSVTGKPYDTIEEVIGLSGSCGNGSLADFGVGYKEIPMNASGVDIPAVLSAAKEAKVVYIQRSRGYSLRNTLSAAEIGEIAERVHKTNPDCIVMVDNCYGEFTETCEPCAVGADLTIGSLIKNPGGGIARTGGYIAGRTDLVELCAYRLTSPGIGGEAGCTLEQNRSMYLGLFLAPNAVREALKSAVFASAVFELMGYEVFPRYSDPRSDIIQSVLLGDSDKLIAFCKAIQNSSPIDSHVTPVPWDMPGYSSQVIMAAGTFTSGASIELSCDAPLRDPYAVWLQGGLVYGAAKLAILKAAEAIM